MSKATREKILWVRAGGRCTWCNRYLLKDEYTGYEYNLGDLAHNVGKKKSSKSPRGFSQLPLEDRNNLENILLVCKDHHTLIDNQLHAGKFTVEYLREVKKKHEDRIEYLTSLKENSRTAVLRLISDIRDTSVELSESAILSILKDEEHWPFYPFSFSGQDFEIDLRGVATENSDYYFDVCIDRINTAVDKFKEGVQKGEISHVSVFALARIPTIVYLGTKLGDKVPIEIHQRMRNPVSWMWSKGADAANFSYRQISARPKKGEVKNVALIVNISGSISKSELPLDIQKKAAIYEIHPKGTTPHLDLMNSRESLSNFRNSLFKFLGKLESTYKQADRLHLFLAVPVSVALVIGQTILKNVHPKIILYDRSVVGREFEQIDKINKILDS